MEGGISIFHSHGQLFLIHQRPPIPNSKTYGSFQSCRGRLVVTYLFVHDRIFRFIEDLFYIELIRLHLTFYVLCKGDNLLKYGWTSHDGLNFGMQDIAERGFNIKTDFVKRPGGNHGGDWTWRISSRKVGAGLELIKLFCTFAFCFRYLKMINALK